MVDQQPPQLLQSVVITCSIANFKIDLHWLLLLARLPKLQIVVTKQSDLLQHLLEAYQSDSMAFDILLLRRLQRTIGATKMHGVVTWPPFG